MIADMVDIFRIILASPLACFIYLVTAITVAGCVVSYLRDRRI